jgi:DNA-binding IclR family transcriptional regulator
MIQSVERAFNVLKTLDSSKYRNDGIGAVDLSKQLKLKFPTTHNFLKTLVTLGWVEQVEDTGKYRLGKEAYSLGRAHNNQKELLERAVPILEEVNGHFNETIILVTYENNLRNVIYQAECRQTLKVSLKLGADDNFYTTATGRALLVDFSKDELKELADKSPLPSGMSLIQLEEKLAFIEQQNFEVIKKSDVTVIGIPLSKPELSLRAAIGAFYPTVRHTGELEHGLVKALQEASKRIERAL